MAAAPPEPPIPPPPASVVRRKTEVDMWSHLSRDGLAAVLAYARALLVRERSGRCRRSLELYRFVKRVTLCAREATEGSYQENDVFIAPLYQQMRARGDLPGVTLAGFKSRLLHAYDKGQIRLSECVLTEGINPMILRASSTGRGDNEYHLVHRWTSGSLYHMLEDVVLALSRSASARVTAYARQVRDDERLRQGRPRLATLSPEAFASRVQEIVNRGAGDMPLVEVFRRLSEGGEATGMGLSEFEARLLAGHRSGRLSLCAGSANRRSADLIEDLVIGDEGRSLLAVRWTGAAPIPWGPPPRIVAPGRVQFACG